MAQIDILNYKELVNKHSKYSYKLLMWRLWCALAHRPPVFERHSIKAHLEVKREVNYAAVGRVPGCRRLTLQLQVLQTVRQHSVVYAPLFLLVPVDIVHSILALTEQWLYLH